MCLCFIKQEKMYKYSLISIAVPEQQENMKKQQPTV